MRSFIAKFVVGCLACVLIASGITPQTTAAASAATTFTAPLTDGQYMCSSTPVPEGWLVKSVAGTCGPFLHYYIERLDNGDSSTYMCSATPVPAGWLVKSVAGTCGPFLHYYIERLDNGDSSTYMCSATPVPAGWLVKSVVGACGPFLHYYIERL